MKKRDLIVTLLYFLDMAVLILSVMFSIWMRNEFRVEALAKEITRGSFWLSVVVLAVIYACVFTLSRTYQVLWEYASMRDACIVAVCAMSSSIAFALIRTALKFPYFAPSIYIMAVLLSGAGVVAVRMVLRTLRRKPWKGITPKSNRNNTMIIGAGDAANIFLGKSRQKFLFLPEEHNDFIFSIVCEELGLVGAGIIMLLFAALILRGYWIALHTRDRFGTLLVVGFTTQLAVQVFLNIGVVTGLLPTTGISLPFFSYGGTALLIQLAEMGVILSVSRQMKPTKAG